MQERKILTINECLELKRPLTLQEAVDLPINTYKEYLYHLGVIKYIPENLLNYVSEKTEDDRYDPKLDVILALKGFEFEFDEISEEENKLNEEKQEEWRAANKEEIDSWETVYGTIFVGEREYFAAKTEIGLAFYDRLLFEESGVKIFDGGVIYV